MKIITCENLLRKENKKVELKDMKNMRKIILKMSDIMRKNGGCGIAAPQVGINKTMFIADLNNRILVAINPVILEHSEEVILGAEGCLSVPNKEGIVPRYKWVKLKYFNGKQFITEIFQDFKAKLVQHEFDHLQGKLYTDVAVEVNEIKKIV